MGCWQVQWCEEQGYWTTKVSRSSSHWKGAHGKQTMIESMQNHPSDPCLLETNLYQTCQRCEILGNDIPFPRSETTLCYSGTFFSSFHIQWLTLIISLVDISLISLDMKVLDLSYLCSRRMAGLIICKLALFMVALALNSWESVLTWQKKVYVSIHIRS